MKQNLDCHIVADLLPLYHDHVVSEETSADIKAHLEHCENCRKEYDLIAQTLPKIEQPNTINRFFDMINRQKTERIFSIICAAVVGCGVAVGAIHFLRNEPVRKMPQEEIEILQSYMVETEEGPELFLWYREPRYSGYGKMVWGLADGDPTRFDIEKTIALLATPQEEWGEGEYVERVPLSWEQTDIDVEEIYINDKLIWSEEENADDVVPSYAQEYVTDRGNSRYADYDYEKGYFGFGEDEEHIVYWDLDGNVIETPIGAE